MGRSSKTVGGGATVIFKPFVDKTEGKFMFKIGYSSIKEDHPAFNDFREGSMRPNFDMKITDANLRFNPSFKVEKTGTVIPAHWTFSLIERDDVDGDVINFIIQLETDYERTIKLLQYPLTLNPLTIAGEVSFWLKRTSKTVNGELRHYENVYFRHDDADVDYRDDANFRFPFGKIDDRWGYKGLTPLDFYEDQMGETKADNTKREQHIFYVMKTWIEKTFDKYLDLKASSDILGEAKGFAEFIVNKKISDGKANRYLKGINLYIRDEEQQRIIKNFINSKATDSRKVGTNKFGFLEFGIEDAVKEEEEPTQPETPTDDDDGSDDLPF